MQKWYNGRQIRQKLKISSQCLYQMKKRNKIQYKQISDKKYLFKLPKSFINTENKNIAIYARVSTSKQKKDLENQINLLKQFAVSNGHIIKLEYVYSDIASGMNQNRSNLNKLIKQIINGNISQVIISNRDRLTRFGYGYFQNLFKIYDVKLTQVNLTEEKTFQEQLTQDLITIIHHFSMKFYGKRKNSLNKIVNELKNQE